MAQPQAEVFARLLTEAVYRIRHRESKTIQAVQDELGYALQKKGGASIEYWRKGNIPTHSADVAALAREIIRRTDLGAEWLEDFLRRADYPHPETLRHELFPPSALPSQSRIVSTPTPALPAATHHLPAQTTPFIGREDELAAIARRLDDPDCRLVTLVGPGGIGKTRLALQVAGEKQVGYPHGVHFVSLASLNSADLLVSTIANAIHFTFFSGKTPTEQLLSYLREKDMLLIMDNFEHLIEGIDLLVEILENAPNTKLLVTSRERLNLRGEWVFEVKGMPFPGKSQNGRGTARSLEDLSHYSAIRLFVQSARRARADFALVEEDVPHVTRICQLVEGIPLGIELAAAWVRLLPCAEIAREIEQNYDFLAVSWRDIPERHRSLQAVFEYSWNLLSAGERQATSKLSVFHGGFRRDAAAYVAGASLFALSTLVDKSFLHWTPGATAGEANNRYEMHELLRLFAEEKLNEGPGRSLNGHFISQEKEAAQNRHCDYFAGFLQQQSAGLKSDRQRETLDAINEELENVRIAWRWAVQQNNLQAIRHSMETLFTFYDVRSWAREGEETFSAAAAGVRALYEAENGLAIPGPAASNDELAALLGQLRARQGRFYHRLGDYVGAREILADCLETFQKLALPEEIIFTLNQLGQIAYRMGEYPEADRLCQESLTLCRELDDRWGMVSALETMGHVAEESGKYTEARQFCQEGLEISRQIGDRRGTATFLNGLGYVLWRLGDYDEAWRLCQESLAIYREIGDRRGIALALKNVGNVAYNIERYSEASEYYLEGLALCREIGYQWGIGAFLNNLGNMAWELGDHNEARQLCLESLEIWRRTGNLWGMAGTLDTLGNVVEEMGNANEARAYFCEALEIAWDIQAAPMALEVLAGMTKLLAREGQQAEALEILTFVLHHPAVDTDAIDKAEPLLADLLSHFDPAEAIAIQERGKAQQLEQLVARMLQV
ncbi:MAG: tetratricopeptide repeat protein [Chloroflexi bacterium]|nr:tetratricopeptide repeat protein [Chloroflexota bacterium]